MSLIVGLIYKDNVYLGSDRQISCGNLKTDSDTAKMFERQGIVFGSVGSLRIGQILEHSFTIPQAYQDQTAKDYLVQLFVPAWRKCLRDNAAVTNNEGIETMDNRILIAFDRQIYVLYSDFSVSNEAMNKYAAIGSGEEFAYGSLHTTNKSTRQHKPKDRVRFALESAADHSLYVGRPFDYLIV